MTGDGNVCLSRKQPVKSTSVGNFPEYGPTAHYSLPSPLLPEVPTGVSLWDFSFCITAPVVWPSPVYCLHCLPFPTSPPQGCCSILPTLPHPQLSRSGSHTLQEPTQTRTAPDTRPSSGLRMSTPSCREGCGYSPCQNSRISFSSFSFSGLPPAGKNRYQIRSVPKQSGLGS